MRKTSFVVLALLTTLTASAAAAAAQTLSSRPVQPPVITVSAVSGTEAWELAQVLARQSAVPFGVESLRPAGQPRVSRLGERRQLTVRGQTIGEVLDAFIAGHPAYQWREENGVITIRPAAAVGDPRNRLNSPVRGLEMRDVLVSDAMEAIKRRFLAGTSYDSDRQPRFVMGGWERLLLSVSFPSGTLLQLLNATVSPHDGLCWHVESEHSETDGNWLAKQFTFSDTRAGRAASLPLPTEAELQEQAAFARDMAAKGYQLVPRRSGETPPVPVLAFLPLDDVRVKWATSVLAQVSGKPFGFEAKPRPEEALRAADGWTRKGVIDLTGMDVRTALDRLMQAAPDYEWFEVDGVFNVCPRGCREDPIDVLNQVVPEFELREATVDQLAVAIHRIFRDESLPPTRPRGQPLTPDAAERDTHTVTLSLRNRTVRDILNAIVATRPNMRWDVTFTSAQPVYDRMGVNFSTDRYSTGMGGPAASKSPAIPGGVR